MGYKLKVLLILFVGMNIASSKWIINLAKLVGQSKKNKTVAMVIAIGVYYLCKRLYKSRKIFIKFLRRYADCMLPEEEKKNQKKESKLSQQGEKSKDDSDYNLNIQQFKKQMLVRCRTLSIIKEEMEGCDE